LGIASAYQAMGDLAQACTGAEQSLALDMPWTVRRAALTLGILACNPAIARAQHSILTRQFPNAANRWTRRRNCTRCSTLMAQPWWGW
jgi:hypothetical protein